MKVSVMSLIGVAVLALPTAAGAAPAARPPAFAMCGACHKVDPAATSALGPNLWDIGGRQAGTQPKFNYSPAMKKAQIKWTRDNLIAFISNPRALVPGNRMAFAGQKDPKAAAAIADYLLSLK